MIKRLLKQHKYSPEGMEDAIAIVMRQCEMWTDNTELDTNSSYEMLISQSYQNVDYELGKVAEGLEYAGSK